MASANLIFAQKIDHFLMACYDASKEMGIIIDNIVYLAMLLQLSRKKDGTIVVSILRWE